MAAANYKQTLAATEATLRTVQGLVARKLTPSPLDDVAATFDALFRAVRATKAEESKLESELEEGENGIKSRQHELSMGKVNVDELKDRKKALMGEIDKLDGVVETLRAKETTRQARVDEGRTTINALEQTAEERGSGMMKEHADEMGELEAQLEEVSQRLTSKQGTLTSLREEERMQEADVDMLLREQRETHESIESVRERIESLQTQVAQTKRKKEQLDSELRATKAKLGDTEVLARDKRKLIAEEKAQLVEHEGTKKRLQDETKSCMDNYAALNYKQTQLEDSIKHQERTNASLVLANERVEQAIANYKNEVLEAQAEKKKLQKLKELTQKKLADLALEKEKVEIKTAALEAKRIELESNIAATRKAEDFTKKQIDIKRRERATLNRGLAQAKTDSDATKEMLIMQSNSSKNLESEVASHRIEALQMRDAILKLETERDKHAAEAAIAQELYDAAREEVEKAEESVAAVQRRIVDSEARLKQQKALFEAVRADRNVHSKHLLAAQSDIAGMKRKFKLMSRTITQLKEDIVSKERQLIRERTQRALVDKQRERLKAELSRIDKMIKSSGKILVGQKSEISALSDVVQKGDAELSRQEKEYASVMHERDILRTQLMQRETEFTTLNEKVKLQRSMLAQGTAQFIELKRNGASLEQELENETLELRDLMKQTEGIDGLRNDMCVFASFIARACAATRSSFASRSPLLARTSLPCFLRFISHTTASQVPAGARADRRGDEDQGTERGARAAAEHPPLARARRLRPRAIRVAEARGNAAEALDNEDGASRKGRLADRAEGKSVQRVEATLGAAPGAGRCGTALAAPV